MRLLTFLFALFLTLQVTAAPLDPTKFTEPVRVACIGDSITFGSGITNGRTYPAQLQDLLGDNWTVRNFGLSGRTLMRSGDRPYWKEPTLQQARNFLPDAVIILLGANDTKPHNWVHKEQFEKDYRDLVAVFQKLTSQPRIFVCRPIPVIGEGNFGINEPAVQEEIAIIDRIAHDLQIDLIDLHAPLEGKDDLIPDRVHPNSEGAGIMAETVALSLSGAAEPSATLLRLHRLFSDHAVLPRDVAVPILGVSTPGDSITVRFAGQSHTTTAQADGHWQVDLRPLTANAEGQTLEVSGNRHLAVHDLLVGDVWLASGQSNMERQLGPRGGQKPILGWREAAATAELPQFREFHLGHRLSDRPLDDVEIGEWAVCSPSSAPQFGAVSFFFGRSLLSAIDVPVGIIHSAWGGTLAEAWTSQEAIQRLQKMEGSTDIPAARREIDRPSVLFNGMIAPLPPFPIKGVLWYQGESNNPHPALYRQLLPNLIADWRDQWKQPDMPFLVVQIAPNERMSPELREAQYQTVQETPFTALIVTTDVGDAKDIHPAAKAPVGERLALAARALAYNDPLEYSGPVAKTLKADGSQLVLQFDHAAGLKALGGPLKGFELAGSDGSFHPATGSIDGNQLRLSSPEVANPVSVRYGWAAVPDANLINGAGLPASPFRMTLP
ncbi:sialate O-acetylesterase [Haloferula luteola]|uniref:Sialate O-acetylesterase n=1 Tax=Haloferula luteola TaxID=595692 RepID=A0A840V2B2_9BACT|nr:GDSL-type esterase/lipase family protein [Haloferula luteola]MBB5352125.1 sialate O-acetylesterase [Haloferula luteola]